MIIILINLLYFQVGKVLKAQYPNRKHRRGKQGSQLYVYRDITIKKKYTKETGVSVSNQILPNDIPSNESKNVDNLISHFINEKNTHIKGIKSRDVENKSIVNPDQVAFLKVLGMQHISTVNSLHKRISLRIENSSKQSYKWQPIEEDDFKIVIDNVIKDELKEELKDELKECTDIKKNNCDQNSLDYDVKSRQNRSDREAFRKSVGRQWIDDHIRQKNGVVTTAAEVCAAYSKDRPEAQLTQTNVSIFNIVSYKLL